MRWIVLACLVVAGCFSKPELSGMTPPLSDGRDDRDGGADGGGDGCPANLVPSDSFDAPPSLGCGGWANPSPMGAFARDGALTITADLGEAYCESKVEVDLTRGAFVALAMGFSAGMDGEEGYLEVRTIDGPVRIGVVHGMTPTLRLTGLGAPAEVTYDAQVMKWWRLAPSVTGSIEGSYSPDGKSWTPLGVQTASATMGTIRLGVSAPAGQAVLGLASLNLCPPP